MKTGSNSFVIRIWLLFAAAIVVCASSTPLARAQSLSTCETWGVGSYGTEQTNCITEWYSGSTPQLTASVEVDSESNEAYVPAVQAEVILTDSNNFLGQDIYSGSDDGPGDITGYASAAVTVTLTPNDVYDLNGGYGECVDDTGNYGYNADYDQWGYCVWSDYLSNPTEDLGTNIFDPSVQVVSVLYAPPGDKSTTGYTNGTTNGTTTSIGSSFSQSYGVEYDGQGEAFGGVIGGSIGYSHGTSNGDTTAYQTTLTDLTAVSEMANTLPTYNPNHLDLPDRKWDSFVTLLNSQITTASDDSDNNIGYSVDLVPVSGDGWTTYPAITEEVAEDMINGTASVQTLQPYALPKLPNQPQYFLPGLASICKNLISSEYNSSTCSPGDQCGCQKSDFSPILSQDTLLGWNPDPNILAANPMPAYESPVDADTSGADCLTPNLSLSCRYVLVPTNPPPQLAYGFDNSFTQDDSTTTSTIFQEQQFNTVTLSTYYGWDISAWGFGGNAKVKNTNSWTWTDTEIQGTINGIQNSMNVDLQTDNPGCVETTFVYEDTRYHTFVVQPPDPQYAPNCLH